jgi:hypothetical protein
MRLGTEQVNNAAIDQTGNLIEASITDIRAVCEPNTLGPGLVQPL